MSTLSAESRQSSRFSRPFKVTDYDDESFKIAFWGEDVNLTGLSFWVDDVDMFLPSQILTLRLRNEKLEEDYILEGVEVVHVRLVDGRYLCGCHITQVTSGQLLAHHRLVMTDETTALVSMQGSALTEFDFVEDGSDLSSNEEDYQEAGMALNLAIAQSEANQKGMQSFIKSTESLFLEPHSADEKLAQLEAEFEKQKSQLSSMNEVTLAFATLAKLLIHSPDSEEERQAWKTLIADFENRFLSEEQQVAYDFMHQGVAAADAIELAEDYLK